VEFLFIKEWGIVKGEMQILVGNPFKFFLCWCFMLDNAQGIGHS
jgi:hypothetical protein